MDAAEAKKVLFNAAELRVPYFDKEEATSAKIAKLEDFALDAANWRGDLESARLWMSDVLHTFTVEWSKLDGWEVSLPGGKRRKDATKDDITEAKRQVRPDLWGNISDLKHLIAQLSNQIRRIEKDEDRVSRVYTFLTGN